MTEEDGRKFIDVRQVVCDSIGELRSDMGEEISGPMSCNRRHCRLSGLMSDIANVLLNSPEPTGAFARKVLLVGAESVAALEPLISLDLTGPTGSGDGMSITQMALDLLQVERLRQIEDKGWSIEHDKGHSLAAWGLILSHEIGCLGRILEGREDVDPSTSGYRSALRKIGGVALASLEAQCRVIVIKGRQCGSKWAKCMEPNIESNLKGEG